MVRRNVARYHGRRGAGLGRLGGAAACAALGLVLALARSWGMWFTGYFLWGAAAVLAASVLLDRLAAEGGAWPRLRRVFYGLLALGLTALVCIEAVIIGRGRREERALPVDAVIVLGAGVNGGEPSASLQSRLEAALEYLKTDAPDCPVVLTGGRGYGEEVTEAACMYEWLTARGVDAGRLILEESATCTAENFSLSKPLLAARGVDAERSVVAVVTNDYHLARAELIAERKESYGAMVGVPARLPWLHLQANCYLREAFAMVKTLIFD